MGNRSGEGELDVAGLDTDPAVGLQGGECVDEGGVAQAAGIAELAAGQWGRGVAESLPRVSAVEADAPQEPTPSPRPTPELGPRGASPFDCLAIHHDMWGPRLDEFHPDLGEAGTASKRVLDA